MILSISILLIIITHPLIMLISVMLLTLYISIIFYLISQFSMISLIIVLLILGGILVIFIYMVRLTPNNKISFNFKILVSIFFILFLLNVEIQIKNLDIQIFNKIYFTNYINLIMLIIIYLILSLNVVIKLTNSNITPMKISYDNKNY